MIELEAGATFTGNFTLPDKSGTNWIYIRSSAMPNLPTAGTPVSPADAARMPKIVSPNTAPAIASDFSAHHYRLMGLEITTTYASTYSNYNLVLLGYSRLGAAATTVNQLPSDLIFDRCYIHGNPTGSVRRGIALNGVRVAVIDSYLSEIHDRNADSQAIMAWNGPGPFKIVGNHLEAATGNVLFGGSDPSIVDLVPSDIEVRNNSFFKPLRWKQDDPSYAGIPWVVKNLLELKNAQRVLVDGNLFEHNWPGGQEGSAILFTVRNQGGTAPWSVVQDVTFTNNIIRHVANGLNILAEDYYYPSQKSVRIAIRNNLIYDLGGRAWGAPANLVGNFIQISAISRGGLDSLSVDHNTVINTRNIVTAYSGTSTNFTFTNNIALHNDYGVIGSGHGPGNDTLDTFFPQAVFAKNALVSTPSPSKYPADDFFPVSIDQVGFANPAADDYRLGPSSPYKNAATDGTDVGVDFDTLDRALNETAFKPPSDPSPTPDHPSASPMDGTPPVVAITSPTDGSTVSGTIGVETSASDNVSVTKTEYRVNGTLLAAFSPPEYSFSWDSRSVRSGPATISVTAYDAAGNASTASVTVTVSNASPYHRTQ